MPRVTKPRATRNTQVAPTEEEFVNVNNKISLDELISIVSLIDFPLNLLPQQNGRAKYRFEKFGEQKQVIYQDVLTIIEQYRSFMEKGYFVIADKRVIDRHGLHEIQKSVLTKAQIEKIVEGSNEAVTIFKSSTEDQKRTIIGMLTRKLAFDPKSLDLNVVDEISRLSKVNIQQNADEARRLLNKEETGDEAE